MEDLLIGGGDVGQIGEGGLAVLRLDGGGAREGAGGGGEGDLVVKVQIDDAGGVLSLDYGLGLEGDVGEHVAMGHARVRGGLRKDQLRCHHVAGQRRSGARS